MEVAAHDSRYGHPGVIAKPLRHDEAMSHLLLDAPGFSPSTVVPAQAGTHASFKALDVSISTNRRVRGGGCPPPHCHPRLYAEDPKLN